MKIHILYTLFFSGLLFTSCKVSRNIQTASTNVDSVVSHVKDSMESVRVRETTELRKMLEEMTSSGVTFVVDSCPERDRIYALLDSTGDKMRLEERLKSLSNKVTISEKGAITAEGNIKAAYFTNSKLQEENYRKELEIDSLHREIDSSNVKYNRLAETKSQVVKKTILPWWIWILAPVGIVFGWIVKSRLSKPKIV